MCPTGDDVGSSQSRFANVNRVMLQDRENKSRHGLVKLEEDIFMQYLVPFYQLLHERVQERHGRQTASAAPEMRRGKAGGARGEHRARTSLSETDTAASVSRALSVPHTSFTERQKQHGKHDVAAGVQKVSAEASDALRAVSLLHAVHSTPASETPAGDLRVGAVLTTSSQPSVDPASRGTHEAEVRESRSTVLHFFRDVFWHSVEVMWMQTYMPDEAAHVMAEEQQASKTRTSAESNKGSNSTHGCESTSLSNSFRSFGSVSVISSVTPITAADEGVTVGAVTSSTVGDVHEVRETPNVGIGGASCASASPLPPLTGFASLLAWRERSPSTIVTALPERTVAVPLLGSLNAADSLLEGDDEAPCTSHVDSVHSSPRPVAGTQRGSRPVYASCSSASTTQGAGVHHARDVNSDAGAVTGDGGCPSQFSTDATVTSQPYLPRQSTPEAAAHPATSSAFSLSPPPAMPASAFASAPSSRAASERVWVGAFSTLQAEEAVARACIGATQYYEWAAYIHPLTDNADRADL